MKKILNLLDLGKKGYSQTWDIQKELHQKRVNEEIPDTLVLVEHPHVYTLGKNADKNNLIANQKYLKTHNIEVHQIDRGGDITYHGPGQLVGYPIFNLKDQNITVRQYVDKIEEVLIRLLGGFNIEATRIKHLTGVWVGNSKIAAIGIRVSRYVSMHGFALNVNTDLSLYNGIIACGITDKGLTKITDLNPEIKWNKVKTETVNQFMNIFEFSEIRSISWNKN